MAVSPLNLTISLAKNSACTSILLTDVSGVVGVDGNTTGYGISGGPAVNDVTSLAIVVTYNSLPTTITYTFTISSGDITACTLTIASGTPADIFDELDPSNLVFPFTADNPFSLFADYGVSIPNFTDDIYSVSYTIEGEVSAEAFEFEAQDLIAVLCASQLCINKKFAALDWTCECASKKSQQAMLGQSQINQVNASTAIGDVSVGLAALERLNLICGTTSGGCGCS